MEREKTVKISVTKPDGTIILIDLSDDDTTVAQPATEPIYDDGDELGDAPSWNAPDAPGADEGEGDGLEADEFPSEDDDTDLEDWGAAGDSPSVDGWGSDHG